LQKFDTTSIVRHIIDIILCIIKKGLFVRGWSVLPSVISVIGNGVLRHWKRSLLP